MYGMKISNNDGNETKPAIFIDAGIHAREWISITTALFIIQQLLKDDNKHLYKNIDWYIFPSMNPDGYEFSHNEVNEQQYFFFVLLFHKILIRLI